VTFERGAWAAGGEAGVTASGERGRRDVRARVRGASNLTVGFQLWSCELTDCIEAPHHTPRFAEISSLDLSLSEISSLDLSVGSSRAPHRDGPGPDILRRTPAAASKVLLAVLVAAVTEDDGRAHSGQRQPRPKLEAIKPRDKMINVHYEVAGAGGTSGDWPRTDAAAARSARRPAGEGLWPSEDEAFGPARRCVPPCDASARVTVGSGCPEGGLDSGHARQLARLALRACVRMHAV
jgi:hypothetical protein